MILIFSLAVLVAATCTFLLGSLALAQVKGKVSNPGIWDMIAWFVLVAFIIISSYTIYKTYPREKIGNNTVVVTMRGEVPGSLVSWLVKTRGIPASKLLLHLPWRFSRATRKGSLIFY